MTSTDLIGGKYELGELIGSGGFSRVYKAVHVEMQRTVALKLLDLEGAVALAGNTTANELQQRFTREARLVSKLVHPNTVTVYDFGLDSGTEQYYIAMEFLDGPDLHTARRKEGAFEPRRAARIARDILRSLAEAHHNGILHRDLKPGNIILVKDFSGAEMAKVLDFGIATVHSAEPGNEVLARSMTLSGDFVGTPQYAAPEQFVGSALTPAADIYAVGLVLWELLSGAPAVRSRAFGACLQAHLDKTPWAIPEGVPDGLAEILGGMIAKDPGQRYASATEVADDIEGWLEGRQESFAPGPVTEHLWEPALDYGGSEAAVIDPNIEGGVPEFLRPRLPDDAKPKARAGADPKPMPTAPAKRREEPLELDYEKAGVKRDSDARAVRPASVARPRRRAKKSPVSLKTAVTIGAVIVGAGIVWSLWPEETPEQIDIAELIANEPMHIELDDDKRGPAIDANRFTTEGILQALEASGWTVRKLADLNTLALGNVHQQGYRLARGGVEVQIELVTTKSHSIAAQMGRETRSPLLVVVFDNKLVRIFPPAGAERGAAAEVASQLTRYRDLVLEAGVR